MPVDVSTCAPGIAGNARPIPMQSIVISFVRVPVGTKGAVGASQKKEGTTLAVTRLRLPPAAGRKLLLDGSSNWGSSSFMRLLASKLSGLQLVLN